MYIPSMLTWFLTMLSIIAITVVEFFKTKKLWLRVGVFVIGTLGIVSSLFTYRESQEQALEIQSLQVTNDSLMDLARAQLRGELEGILGHSQLTASGLYMRMDKFRSKWAQDVQDVVIYMKFDNMFQRVKVRQRTTGGILNVTCPSVDTSLAMDNLQYPCGFLAKGDWIEIQTYSKKPLILIEKTFEPSR